MPDEVRVRVGKVLLGMDADAPVPPDDQAQTSVWATQIRLCLVDPVGSPGAYPFARIVVERE